ncbi:MAG: shikimate kinase, partial [Acidimicrobiales bacterium]
LRAEPAELVSRVGGSSRRPLLDGDAAGRLAELAVSRAGNYGAVADAVIDTDGLSPAGVVARVRAAVNRAGQDGADGTEPTDG